MEIISKDGYKKLCDEYRNIDNEILQIQKAMGESAKRDNDLRENPEYMELRVQAMYTLPQKKQQLAQRVNNCLIIEEQDEYKLFDGKVIAGSTVKIIFDGEEQVLTILGDNEGDLKRDIISCKAPLAMAILGKRVGDTVNFNNMIIEIEDITKI